MFLMNKNQSQDKFNKPLYGMVGEYTLSEGVSLPYFLTVMEIERAIEELKVAENIPASIDNKWSLQELFQREIDQKRIMQDIIRGYLKDPKKLKFFNAITIVLMPIDNNSKILEKFPENELSPPPIPWDGTDEYDKMWSSPEVEVVNFCGVQFAKISTQARLRWDENKVFAAAVDGQHRLWALRTYKEDPSCSGGTLKLQERNTKIPVLFVLLHEKAGFKSQQDGEDLSIRAISRELFTDLNKNAKTVDKARELILDDKSISARCVRTLITNSTSQDIEGRLPLSLIRWQDDSNRFDTNYYLNSLVHLELMISSLLSLEFPKDPMEKRNVLAFIESLNIALGTVDGKIEYEGKTIDRYYEQDCCDDDGEPSVPFSRLPEYFLSSAVEGFIVNFKPWILKLLLEFKPYKNLLEYAREKNLIEGTFSGYQSQTKRHKAKIKDEENALDSNWYEREILLHERHISGLKENQWAFKTIFQKALLRLGKLIAFENIGENRLGTIDDLLDFMNDLYDRNLLVTNAELPEHPFFLWTFISLNSGNGKIKVAKSVEDRIYSILCLWYFGNRKFLMDTANGEKLLSQRKLLNFFAAAKNQVFWPGCADCYTKIKKGFGDAALFGGRNADVTDEQKEEIIKSRFADLLIIGINGYHQNQETQEEDVE